MVPVKAADGSLLPQVGVPPSPLLPEVVEAEEKTVHSLWPGLPVVSTMSTGATDGRYLRIAGIPTYGIACMFFELNDNRAHGKDERIGAKDFYDGVEVNYRLIKVSLQETRHLAKKMNQPGKRVCLAGRRFCCHGFRVWRGRVAGRLCGADAMGFTASLPYLVRVGA